MNATLQCLIHCKPLQDLFLRTFAHPYQSCGCLRGSNKTSCLTCELDKIFLEYYGSAVGIDAMSALEEQPELLSKQTLPSKDSATDSRGHPIIPSSLLAEVWKNRGMRLVAGHAQHDAQEFFNAFIDCLASHALAYQKSAQETRQTVHETQIKKQSNDGTNPEVDEKGMNACLNHVTCFCVEK